MYYVLSKTLVNFVEFYLSGQVILVFEACYKFQ